MCDDLVKAFGRRIDTLAWMSPQTKAKAKEKLATLKIGIGYPDTWRDYSTLQVVRGDALGNATRAELFEYRRNLLKLGKSPDRSEWWMTPQTVNAVNLPLQNALNFPAAILQPPYFDPRGDAAINYGAIGAVIGHEISHSFDDVGSQFDAQGRLNNWWTKDDFAHFKAASEKLAAQYDAYRPFPDLAVNGHQTLGENIADVAGLSAAYDAFTLSLGGKPAPCATGLHRRSAVLHQLRSELAHEKPRGGAAQPDRHRRPRAGPVPRRHRSEPRCMVRGVSGQAGPEASPGACRSRPRLVIVCQ